MTEETDPLPWETYHQCNAEDHEYIVPGLSKECCGQIIQNAHAVVIGASMGWSVRTVDTDHD